MKYFSDCYDVIVCGGGPSGIAAAVSSARQGAKTALVERYGIIGGMLTSGLVCPLLGSVAPGTIYDEIVSLLRSTWIVTKNGKEMAFGVEEAKLKLLKLVADALSRVSRKFNSNVFRIGGDEFVIITDTSEEGLAIDITNAIKKEFDNMDFREDWDIEISLGTALYDGKSTIDELLNSADKKLYEAKRS